MTKILNTSLKEKDTGALSGGQRRKIYPVVTCLSADRCKVWKVKIVEGSEKARHDEETHPLIVRLSSRRSPLLIEGK